MTATLAAGVLLVAPPGGVERPGSGITTLASVSTDGQQGNHRSFQSALSADGQHVAFGRRHLHRRRTLGHLVRRALHDGPGLRLYSRAPSLVEGDTNGDVFLWHRTWAQAP